MVHLHLQDKRSPLRNPMFTFETGRTDKRPFTFNEIDLLWTEEEASDLKIWAAVNPLDRKVHLIHTSCYLCLAMMVVFHQP